MQSLPPHSAADSYRGSRVERLMYRHHRVDRFDYNRAAATAQFDHTFVAEQLIRP